MDCSCGICLVWICCYIMLSYIMLYLRILYHWYYIISPSKTAWIQIEMVPIVSNIIPKVLSSNCQWAMDGKTFMTDDPAWTSRKCSSARNFASSSFRDKALYCSNKVRTTRICWHRQTTTNENKGTYKSAPQRKQTQRQFLLQSFGEVTPNSINEGYGPGLALDAFGLTIA